MSPPQENPPRPLTSPPARGLYEILNVSRKASSREIRRAYRDLARKYHPDFNSGEEAAARKFREVQEAYEILGDPRKRKAYDYYGAEFGERAPVRAADPVPRPNAPRSGVGTGKASDAARHGARDFTPFPSFRSSGSYPRLATRARLGSLTVAAVFVFGTIGYLLLPNAGVKEFERAQEALKHVTSWKVEGRLAASDSATGEYLVEVSCPSSERTTRHIRPSASQSGAREFTLEDVAIGNDHYTRVSWANRWTHIPTAGTAATVACAYLQRLQDAPGLPPLQRWLSGSYVIEKESVRETPDGKCREWRIVTPGGFSSAPNTDFVCLGVKDHLPKFQGASGSSAEVRFYDWNVPIEIVAPTLTDSP